MLKPQDIVVLLKLTALGHSDWSYSLLASELGMSQSEVHAAIKRATAAQLAYKGAAKIAPNTEHLFEFVAHGLKYMCAPVFGKVCTGIPTAFSAPSLRMRSPAAIKIPYVWPDPESEVKGLSFLPLYKSVPKAAKQDNELYILLALVDAIRGGCAIEQRQAKQELAVRFKMA